MRAQSAWRLFRSPEVRFHLTQIWQCWATSHLVPRLTTDIIQLALDELIDTWLNDEQSSYELDCLLTREEARVYVQLITSVPLPYPSDDEVSNYLVELVADELVSARDPTSHNHTLTLIKSLTDNL